MKKTLPKNAFICIAIIIVLLSTCKKDEEIAPVRRAIGLFFTAWTDQSINKIDLINTPNSITKLYDAGDGIQNPEGIALTSDGYLLVTDQFQNLILRMHKNGSGTIDVIYDNTDGVSAPAGITVDNATGNIYWCNTGTNQVMKGTDDGSATPVAMFGGDPVIALAYGIAIDKIHGKIYTCDFSGRIKVGNLDGSGTMSILYDNSNYAGMGCPSNIFISPERNTIYWSDECTDEITVAPLDGTGTPTVLFDDSDGINRADGIYVDYHTNKIYWSETNNDVIARGNLDGSGIRGILVDNIESYALVLEFE